MRQLIGLVVLVILAARVVDLSLDSAEPIVILAPSTIAALTVSAMCIAYVFRDDS